MADSLTESDLSAPPETGRVRNAFIAILALIAVSGLVFRLLPLLDPSGKTLWLFPTEDGYLMLTISRNIAAGLGMSIADGLTPTNGTQPLCTFLWAGIVGLVDGDRVAGVWIVHLVQTVFALLAALLLYRFAHNLFQDRPSGGLAAAAAAVTWFAAPLTVAKTQNCLETGAYTLVVLAVATILVSRDTRVERPWTIRFSAICGLLVGIAFWTRNDAVFLAVAVCVTQLTIRRDSSWDVGWNGMFRAGVLGVISLGIAAPWLFFNYLNFGSIVPVSGYAQEATVFASKLTAMPHCLAVMLTIVLPDLNHIPVLPHRAKQVGFVLLLVGVAVVLFRQRRSIPRESWRTIIVVAIYSGLLTTYYGLTSNAHYHFGRYLTPVSPFLWLATVALLHSGALRLRRGCRNVMLLALMLITLVLVVGRSAQTYARGTAHTHRHHSFWQWVEEAQLRGEWIGAYESGTLGFFYDKTINLDGKVNPYALAARHGRFSQLIVESQLEYIISSIEAFDYNYEGLSEAFVLIERDEARDFAVMRRRDTEGYEERKTKKSFLTSGKE